MSIVLYSTPSCSYCKLVKNWFSERNIRIEEYNIASDPRKAEEMLRKSGQMGVPVTDVNGEIVIGFNQIALERALRR